MKAYIVEIHDQTISILITNGTLKQVNQLRRDLMMKPKTFAVNEVTFNENSSAFSDDFIAHRLGMICMDVLFDYAAKSEEIILSIQKECVRGSLEITSDDLQIFVEPEEVVAEGAAKVQMNGCHKTSEKKEKHPFKILEGIQIAKIIEGQKIDLTCKVVQGCGEMNVRWNPVTKCVYRRCSEVRPEASDNDDGQFLMTLETNKPFNTSKIFWEVWHSTLEVRTH